MSTQAVEAEGRALVMAALARARINVATPAWDNGIDLVAFEPPTYVPLQLKVATGAVFNLDRKYEQIAGLRIVYVWIAEGAFFVLTFGEAMDVLVGMGYAATASWMVGGYYASNKPGARLRERLEPHRVIDWRAGLGLLTPARS